MSSKFLSTIPSSQSCPTRLGASPFPLAVAVLLVLASIFGMASQSLAYVKDPDARGDLYSEFPCAAEECEVLGIDRWMVYRLPLSGPATLSQNDEYIYLVGVDVDGAEVDEFRIFRAGVNYTKTDFPDGSSPIAMINKEGLEILFDVRAALADGFKADALAVDPADIVSHSRSFLGDCTIKRIAWGLATAQAIATCSVDRTTIACRLAIAAATLAYTEMARACGTDVPEQICTPGESATCICNHPFECDQNRPIGLKYCRADGLSWTGCDYGCPSAPPQDCDIMCDYPGQVDESGHCTNDVCPDGQLGRRVCESDLIWSSCTCEGDNDYHVCDADGQVNPFSEASCADVECPDSNESAVQVCVTDQQGRRDWSDCFCPSSGDSACTEVGRIDPSDYCQSNCDSGSGERYCTSNIDGELEWGLCFCDSDEDGTIIPNGPAGGPEGGFEILPQSACPGDFSSCGWEPGGSLLCRYCEVTLVETGECLLWSEWMLCGALP